LKEIRGAYDLTPALSLKERETLCQILKEIRGAYDLTPALSLKERETLCQILILIQRR